MFSLKLVLLALLALSSTRAAAESSLAGTLNSLEGEVSVNGAPVPPINDGRRRLDVGGVISTDHGMAELLLAPGSFLRIGERSKLTLEAIGTLDFQARLESGEALLEVIALPFHIVLKQNGVNAVIRKPGLYEFDQKRALMTVYAGEAQFNKGASQTIASQGFSVGVRRLRKYASSPTPGDSLLSWSKIRSEQLSDESAASAHA